MTPSSLTPGWYRMRWSTWDFVALVYHDGTTMVFRHPSGAVHAVADFPTATWTPTEFPSHNAAATPETVAPLQPAARVGSQGSSRVLSSESCPVDGKPEGVVTGSEVLALVILATGLGVLVWSDLDPVFVMGLMVAALLVVIFVELGTVFRASAPVQGSGAAFSDTAAGARSLPQSSPTPGANPIR